MAITFASGWYVLQPADEKAFPVRLLLTQQDAKALYKLYKALGFTAFELEAAYKVLSSDQARYGY